jgi:hypothetical protein
MSNLFFFTGGIVLGVYLDQKYDLPKVSLMVDKGVEYLKSIEKDD